jgi:hypothetical protein
MAPDLALSLHQQIRNMTISKFANAIIARTVCCSTCSVQNIRSNFRYFRTRQCRTITPPMLSALLEQLVEKAELYQDEMVIFLYNEFDFLVATF